MTTLTRQQEHLLARQAEHMYDVFWLSLGVHVEPFTMTAPPIQQAWLDVARMVVGQIGRATTGKRG